MTATMSSVALGLSEIIVPETVMAAPPGESVKLPIMYIEEVAV